MSSYNILTQNRLVLSTFYFCLIGRLLALFYEMIKLEYFFLFKV